MHAMSPTPRTVPRKTSSRGDGVAPVDVPPGLAGVVVTETAIGDVRGREGFYHYRQYSAVELAQVCAFEDVWYLLAHGELPDPRQRAAFVEQTAALRDLPQELREALPAIAAASLSAVCRARAGSSAAARSIAVRASASVRYASRRRRQRAVRSSSDRPLSRTCCT